MMSSKKYNKIYNQTIKDFCSIVQQNGHYKDRTYQAIKQTSIM